MDEARKAPSVQIAKQGADTRDWSWVEASVWTDRMLSALGNGVKGGVWYSVVDKVYAPATLAAAWAKVKANGGAAGVDRQSIERFAAHADVYLAELSRALRAGDYRPAAIRRVEIPKGDGRVEAWRGGGRLSISVSAPFGRRCLSGSTMAPFPRPAHRTGQADLLHPALGQDLTPSSTACRAQTGSGVRARIARRVAKVDSSRPCSA